MYPFGFGSAMYQGCMAFHHHHASSKQAQLQEQADAPCVDDNVGCGVCAGDRPARLLGGLLLRELVRGAPDAFAAHASAALPCAFLACNDEEKDVASLWKEVWEEGTGSGSAAVRLYLADIVPLVCAGAL